MALSPCCKAKIIESIEPKGLKLCQACMNEVFLSSKPVSQKSRLEEQFLELMIQNGISRPTLEYRFNPERRWRFDFAWPERMIAVELEGGIWIQGRHSRGKGMLNDMEKYNTALLMGWKVFRYATNNMTAAINDLKGLLK